MPYLSNLPWPLPCSFNMMDGDGSGRITFKEFEEMAREELEVDNSQL